jgi:hypothetical protein
MWYHYSRRKEHENFAQNESTKPNFHLIIKKVSCRNRKNSAQSTHQSTDRKGLQSTFTPLRIRTRRFFFRCSFAILLPPPLPVAHYRCLEIHWAGQHAVIRSSKAPFRVERRWARQHFLHEAGRQRGHGRFDVFAICSVRVRTHGWSWTRERIWWALGTGAEESIRGWGGWWEDDVRV